MKLFRQDDVGVRPVLIQPQADGAQRNQRVRQFFGMGKGGAVGGDGDHALSLPVHADHQVADQPLPGFLPVGFHVKHFHPGQECGGQRVRRRHGIGAGGGGNDRMAPGSIKTQYGFLVRAARGQGGLVPVAEGGIHPDHRRHVRFDPGDAPETVFHLLTLRVQGGFIAHMAAAAASAAGIGRAVRNPPVHGCGVRHRFHPAEGIAFFSLHDPDRCGFTGQHAGNEHRHPFVDADALQIRAEAFGGQGEAFVLFHRLRSFHIGFFPIIQGRF